VKAPLLVGFSAAEISASLRFHLARPQPQRTGFLRGLLVALTVLSSVAFAQTCPTRASWPTTDWPESLVTGKDTQIAALEKYAFTLTGKDADREGLRTESVLIIKSGTIIYEKYAHGFSKDNRHLSWSVAKSYSSALMGVAVKEGVVDLNASICNYLPEYKGKAVCAIRVIDTITFAPAMRWQEGYEHASYQTSSVISMLFGEGHRDQLAFILGHDMIGEPGKHWMYSTGTAELASAIAQRALEPIHGRDAFWKLFFNPIGSGNAIFEYDASGTPLGGSMVFATSRDYAKFGYLYLNDGCWDGARVVPEGWVASSTKPSDPFINYADPSEDTPSGYMWWLNAARPPPLPRERPWPDVPADAFFANGHWGQYIIVIPSLDLVIVRTGDDRNDNVDLNQFAKLAIEVAQ
jgi:CubicO group peptidase (beta-lactamase class C family)